jgi:hypothetical protein
MTEAVSTSETSVYFYETTQRNIAEDSQLHTHRRLTVKQHRVKLKKKSNMTQRREAFCLGDFFRIIYTYCEEMGITVNPTFLPRVLLVAQIIFPSLHSSCGWLSRALEKERSLLTTLGRILASS